MPVLNRVLHFLDIEKDAFFVACKVDIKTVSFGTARLSELNELILAVEQLPSAQQDHLRHLAQRLDNLSSQAGQELLDDLNVHGDSQDDLKSPFDKLMCLYRTCYDDFCRVEAIFYTDNFMGRKLTWDGYRLPEPIPLSLDSDLSALRNGLEELFKGTPFVIKTYHHERLNYYDEKISSIQYMIYRRGFATPIEVVNEEINDIDNQIIYPARIYSLVYEPATGIIHFYGRMKEIRNSLGELFCKTVLGYSGSLDKLMLFETQLDLLRTPIDLASKCRLKYGLEKIVVKHIHAVLLPENEPIDIGAKPRDPFTSDVYNALRKQGALHLLLNKNLVIRSVTLVLRFHQEDSLPAECIDVVLKAPYACSLPDNTIRNKYIHHEIFIESGLLREVPYD